PVDRNDNNGPSGRSNEDFSERSEDVVMNGLLAFVVRWLRGINSNSELRVSIGGGKAKAGLGPRDPWQSRLPSRWRAHCDRIELAIDDIDALRLPHVGRTPGKTAKLKKRRIVAFTGADVSCLRKGLRLAVRHNSILDGRDAISDHSVFPKVSEISAGRTFD